MPDVRTILNERQATHGSFAGHARICQQLKDMVHATDGWHRLAHDQREALDMVIHKVARVLNGNPNVADHWIDIAGYAQLVADRLEQEQSRG
jgi:hypothetical protein